MPRSNEAVVVRGVKDVRVESVSLEKMGENDILVAMDKIGICGTDLHIYLDGTIKGHTKDHITPWVIGHEGCGRVLEVGPSVVGVQVGDRVALNPNQYCQTCVPCTTRTENVCTNSKVYRWTHRGLLERYHVHPADCAFKIPESLSFEEASFIEPLSCAVHACRRSGLLKPGQTVLICGAGPLGLLHMLVAKAWGAGWVIITDINQNRLEVAIRLGVDKGILIDPTMSPEFLGRQIQDELGGGIDVVMEVSGAEFSVELGIHAARPGGRVMVIGVSSTGRSCIPINTLLLKQIDMLTSHCFKPSCFEEAMKLLESGQVEVKQLISNTFSHKDIMKAFQILADQSKTTIKILIDFNDQ